MILIIKYVGTFFLRFHLFSVDCGLLEVVNPVISTSLRELSMYFDLLSCDTGDRITK